MNRKGIKNSGFAIAIAWPETHCKQPGSWYDDLMGRFGINRNNYYRAGHAALVIVPFTPTPMNNVSSLTNRVSIPHLRKEMPSCPQPVRDKRTLKTTLPEPVRPTGLTVNAQWLSGEGAGSWFSYEPAGNNFRVSRFSPKGVMEWENIFTVLNDRLLDIDKPYRFEHISHYKKVRLTQNGEYVDLTAYLEYKTCQPASEVNEEVLDGYMSAKS